MSGDSEKQSTVSDHLSKEMIFLKSEIDLIKSQVDNSEKIRDGFKRAEKLLKIFQDHMSRVADRYEHLVNELDKQPHWNLETNATVCPECLGPAYRDELHMFEGLCEECSGAFDD